MDAQSSQTPDHLVDQLRFQLSTTRGRVAKLQQEKLDMQAEFEYKQSKMKEQFFEKEDYVQQQNMKLFEAGRQISTMESKILSLHEEIENIKMVASVSENTKEEAVQDLNRLHQEEIESLRQVLHDSMEEQRRELVVEFEQERRRWEQEKAEMEEEKKEVAPSELNRFSQSRRKKGNEQRKQESELSMKKAQLEAETLKAVVLPLEAEIQKLKEKVKQMTTLEQDFRNMDKDRTPNGTLEVITVTDTQNSGIPTITCDKAASDDESFLPFQSYRKENLQPCSAHESESTTPTELQDSISISSVSSLPSSTGLVPADMVRTHRVLSAPHLNRLAGDQTTEKHKKPRAWDEIASNSTERSESPQEALEFTSTSSADKELVALKEKCSKFQEEAAELKKLLDKERKARIQVEDSVAHATEEAQKQITDLNKKLTHLEDRMEEDRSWRKRKETEDDKRLSLLQKDREIFRDESLQIKKENERVKALFNRHKAELDKDLVLSTNMEGLSFQVRQYREALLVAKVEKSHVESRLQSKLGFMQERLNSEQVAKKQLEMTLLAELDKVKRELASLRDVRGRLHREASEKRDLLAQAERDQLSFDSIRAKSKEIIQGLKEKLKSETSLKMKLEEIRQREEETGFPSPVANSHPPSNRAGASFDAQSSGR